MNNVALNFTAFVVLGGAALIGSGPASAHHSYAMFDRDRRVTISGTVKTYEWAAPHIYVWVDVPNNKGGSDLWGLEGGSPSNLMHRGWTRNTLKTGDKVTVVLQPLKDGRNGGYFVKGTKADGTSIGGDGAAG